MPEGSAVPLIKSCATYFYLFQKIFSGLENKYQQLKYLVATFTLVITRKYPLRGYILGVLTHTTAWDRLWGGDGTLTMWF